MVCMVSLAVIMSSGYSMIMTQAPTSAIEPAVIVSPAPTSASSYSAAIEKVMPSVVCIYVEKNTPSGGKPAFEGGSGVILRADGCILTNRHVVQDAKTVWVTQYDRSTCEAVSVYSDMLLDLAVVKIDAGGLPAAAIGDSDKLRVGDPVIAVGNPLGLSPSDGVCSATTGIVSRRDYSFVMQGVPYYDMIQTDAAISTGNSGGPLVNLDGEVVGINSAHALFAQNVGFALSMNTAKRVFDDLATLRKTSHPYMGITAEYMKPQVKGTTMVSQLHTVITMVEDGSPADIAGLKVDDVILSINGLEIHMLSDLFKTIWRMGAGDSMQVTVLRRGETLLLNVRLATRPDSKPLSEL